MDRDVEDGLAKLALLKLRGWQFLFYPADICEVKRPYETDTCNGHFIGAWNLANQVKFFYEEEFGDG